VLGPLVSAEIVRSRFEIVYVGVDGEHCREPLTVGWRVQFEEGSMLTRLSWKTAPPPISVSRSSTVTLTLLRIVFLVVDSFTGDLVRHSPRHARNL